MRTASHRRQVRRKYNGSAWLTIDTLVLAVLVNVVEISQHLDQAQMRPGVVDDSFRAVFDQVPARCRQMPIEMSNSSLLEDSLQKHESLVDLPPLPGLLLRETSIDRRHDLIEQLAVRRVHRQAPIRPPGHTT